MMRIKRLRIEELAHPRPLTDIARLLGRSSAGVSQWNRGVAFPSLNVFFELTQILDCEMEELIVPEYQ